jgi:hypothetical protein
VVRPRRIRSADLSVSERSKTVGCEFGDGLEPSQLVEGGCCGPPQTWEYTASAVLVAISEAVEIV